jgi:hypothetical protein
MGGSVPPLRVANLEDFIKTQIWGFCRLFYKLFIKTQIWGFCRLFYKLFCMYFFLSTGTLHHIKDGRAHTLSRKRQFWGNFRGFSSEKPLGIFNLKSGVFKGFFRNWVGNPAPTSCNFHPVSDASN